MTYNAKPATLYDRILKTAGTLILAAGTAFAQDTPRCAGDDSALAERVEPIEVGPAKLSKEVDSDVIGPVEMLHGTQAHELKKLANHIGANDYGLQDSQYKRHTLKRSWEARPTHWNYNSQPKHNPTTSLADVVAEPNTLDATNPQSWIRPNRAPEDIPPPSMPWTFYACSAVGALLALAIGKWQASDYWQKRPEKLARISAGARNFFNRE